MKPIIVHHYRLQSIFQDVPDHARGGESGFSLERKAVSSCGLVVPLRRADGQALTTSPDDTTCKRCLDCLATAVEERLDPMVHVVCADCEGSGFLKWSIKGGSDEIRDCSACRGKGYFFGRASKTPSGLPWL